MKKKINKANIIKKLKLRSKFGKNQKHWYHMVTVSPWPLVGSLGALSLTISAVMYFHGYIYSGLLLLNAFFVVIGTMVFWWRDVIRESTFGGYHTKVVVAGLRIGMILFITSEVMFFFSFFWAFFHSSLAPNISIGCIWPPMGIQALAPLHIPLLNTLILLTSGVTITYSHYALCAIKWYYWPFNDKSEAVSDLLDKFLQGIWINNKTVIPVWLWGIKVYEEKDLEKEALESYKKHQETWRFLKLMELEEYDFEADRRNRLREAGIRLNKPGEFRGSSDKDKVDPFYLTEYTKQKNQPFPTDWNFDVVYKDFRRMWKKHYGNTLQIKLVNSWLDAHDAYIMRDQYFTWWLLSLYFPRVNELSVIGLGLTIFLAIEFTLWQFFEYMDAFFYISDGIYGSTFYMTTGFHGLHVIIGTIFLIVCLFRMFHGHFRHDHHFGFEAAIWYWHFVDVVWLFLFLWVYVWSYGF